jgi:hypothetical protein
VLSGKHQCQKTRMASRTFEAPFLGSSVECTAQQRCVTASQSRPDVYLLLQSVVSRLVGEWTFSLGTNPRISMASFFWWMGGVVRYTYKFGDWLSADSAG